MTTPDIVAAVTPVVDELERLGVPYCIAGSVASSAQGIARATLDVDLVVDLKRAHVAPLTSALEPGYYVDSSAALDAVERRGMFNVIHLDTMLKVDLYVLKDRDFDRASFRRRREGVLEAGERARTFLLDSPEDTILHKLEWYRAGGEVSERQWGDVVGVLRVQAGRLDDEYLDRWATTLGVLDLLTRARQAPDAPD